MQADGDLFCLDWTADEFQLHGSWYTGLDYAAVDIGLYPCGSLLQGRDGITHGAEEECEWDESKVRDYVGRTFELVIYYNLQEFDHQEFGLERVDNKADFKKIWTAAETAKWNDAQIMPHELMDEVDIVQLGQQRIVEFESTYWGDSGTSDYSEWPTKEDPSLYKFNGVWLELSKEKVIIERQTYSLLEWLGDVGGLFDGLHIIFGQLLKPFALFSMKWTVFQHIFNQFKQFCMCILKILMFGKFKFIRVLPQK